MYIVTLGEPTKLSPTDIKYMVTGQCNFPWAVNNSKKILYRDVNHLINTNESYFYMSPHELVNKVRSFVTWEYGESIKKNLTYVAFTTNPLIFDLLRLIIKKTWDENNNITQENGLITIVGGYDYQQRHYNFSYSPIDKDGHVNIDKEILDSESDILGVHTNILSELL